MRSVERFPGPSRESSAEDIRQRLRDLPKDLHAPYDWTEFRLRERRRRARELPKRSAIVKWEHAAAAAGVTVLIASMAMWGRSDQHLPAVSSSGISISPLPATAAGGAESTEELNAKINALVQARATEMSQAAQEAVASQMAALTGTPESERWLEQQPHEPAVVRVGPRLAVANLEDRIAWMDDALSDAQLTAAGDASVRALRQQRARLVSSLAQVRYAETLAAGMP